MWRTRLINLLNHRRQDYGLYYCNIPIAAMAHKITQVIFNTLLDVVVRHFLLQDALQLWHCCTQTSALSTNSQSSHLLVCVLCQITYQHDIAVLYLSCSADAWFIMTLEALKLSWYWWRMVGRTISRVSIHFRFLTSEVAIISTSVDGYPTLCLPLFQLRENWPIL